MKHDDLLHLAATTLAGPSWFDAMLTITDVRDKAAGYKPDIVIVTQAGRWIECEVKVSDADLRANAAKQPVRIGDERWMVTGPDVTLSPPSGWGWVRYDGRDFIRVMDPAETCLDQPDMKGALSNDPRVWLLLRQLRKQQGQERKAAREKPVDDLVKRVRLSLRWHGALEMHTLKNTAGLTKQEVREVSRRVGAQDFGDVIRQGNTYLLKGQDDEQ